METKPALTETVDRIRSGRDERSGDPGVCEALGNNGASNQNIRRGAGPVMHPQRTQLHADKPDQSPRNQENPAGPSVPEKPSVPTPEPPVDPEAPSKPEVPDPDMPEGPEVPESPANPERHRAAAV